MGDKDLESFMEEYLLTECCQYVDLEQLSQLYRKQSGRMPVMVVDGPKLIQKFYYNSDVERDFLSGGQLKDFTEFAKTFVRKLKDVDIRPVFYFNGAAVGSKVYCQSEKESRMLKRDMLFGNLNNLKPYRWNKWKILPLLICEMAPFVFKYECKCHVLISVKNSSKELADFANRESCFGILSQDTDFLCLKNAVYYLSLKYLNLKDMKTLCYDRVAIRKYFDFTEQQMWLFVLLLGNSTISEERLKYFHLNICGRNHSFRRKCEMIAKFVKEMTGDCSNNIQLAVSRIMEHFNQLRLDVQDTEIRKSLQSYMTSDLESWISNKDIENSWIDILEVAYKRHIECDSVSHVYNILMDRPHKVSLLLERTNLGCKDSSRVFLPLRQRIYSLLLHEKPRAVTTHSVKEFGMWDNRWHDVELVDVPAYIEDIPHPGLVTLWTKYTLQVNVKRWALFGNTLSRRLNPDVLSRLNHHYVIPTVVLVYLMDESYGLRDDEIDSFIKQAVTVFYLELEGMDPENRLKIPNSSERMVNLSTLFGYGISMVLFLMSALGFPLEKAMPWYYFDGPLFHYFLVFGKQGKEAVSRLSRYFALEQVQAKIWEDIETIKNIIKSN